jgi:putative MATE family efflux protein
MKRSSEVPQPEPMDLLVTEAIRLDKKTLDREIMFLAIPVFIAQGSNSAVVFIGRVIVSKLGAHAFNSVNIGMLVFMLIITVITAVSVGSTTAVAQNCGAGNKRRANEILQQSLIAGFIISMLIAAVGLATRNILFSFLGTEPETAKLGSQYLLWLYIGLPLLTPGFFMASSLRGAGDTKTPMYAGLVTAVLTLFLSYGFVLGKFGMPRLEVVGAALAIDIAFGVFTSMLAIFILTKRTVLTFPGTRWRPDIPTCCSIVAIGLPSASEWLLIQLGVLIYVPVVAYYGKDVLAGFFTGLAVFSLSQSVPIGFQAASNTLVGQSIGAKNYFKAETVFRRMAYLGFVTMTIIGACIFLFSKSPVFSVLFENLNPRALAYGRTYAQISAYAMPLMGISFSIAGGLRGMGNTFLPFIASTFGIYGARITLAFAMYFLFHPPVYIIWCTIFPDFIGRIILMASGLKSGRWKSIEVKL